MRPARFFSKRPAAGRPASTGVPTSRPSKASASWLRKRPSCGTSCSGGCSRKAEAGRREKAPRRLPPRGFDAGRHPREGAGPGGVAVDGCVPNVDVDDVEAASLATARTPRAVLYELPSSVYVRRDRDRMSRTTTTLRSYFGPATVLSPRNTALPPGLMMPREAPSVRAGRGEA
ncbi:hypothetical protein BOS5A_10801 [Bosea sp. EC-HK365B]|nr:hypothetical protein BOSE21B_10275 [Bosea sp. 21B]CAD5267513.1 hypothetical protein BOSE7B_150861 [Bosea sp. 7B]VVT45425.1 hypothetical protein BOS5A_10801 [Bosea sp. EC-HK365B]VXC56781.1 hypothetical protein BOSE127_190488 [Bosea sp. 127]